jgi:hypothetical protein
MLRDVLTAAAEVVVEGRHVGELASRLNVSPRTLVRHLHSAGLPSARTLLGAARVLWACAIAESAPGRDIAVTARLCGFGTTSRMIRLARQYAVLAGGSAAHPSFPSYDSALAAVVDARRYESFDRTDHRSSHDGTHGDRSTSRIARGVTNCEGL